MLHIFHLCKKLWCDYEDIWNTKSDKNNSDFAAPTTRNSCRWRKTRKILPFITKKHFLPQKMSAPFVKTFPGTDVPVHRCLKLQILRLSWTSCECFTCKCICTHGTRGKSHSCLFLGSSSCSIMWQAFLCYLALFILFSVLVQVWNCGLWDMYNQEQRQSQVKVYTHALLSGLLVTCLIGQSPAIMYTWLGMRRFQPPIFLLPSSKKLKDLCKQKI